MVSLVNLLARPPYRASADGAGAVDPFAPIVAFLFFYGFEFVLPYLYVLAGGEFVSVRARTLGLTHLYVEKAALASLLFAVGWVAAYMLFWRRSPCERLTLTSPRFSVGVAFVIYCGVLVGFFAVIHGSPASGEGKAAMVQGMSGGVLVMAMSLLLSMLAVLLITLDLSVINKPGQLASSPAIGILWLVSGATLLAFLLLQMRARALTTVMLAVMIWHYGRHRVTLSEYIGFMLFATLGAVAISYTEVAYGSSRMPSFADVAFGLDYRRNFDGLYNAALLIQHVDSRGEPYDFGMGVLTDFLADLRAAPQSSTGSRVFFMEEVIGLGTYKAGIALSKVGELYRAGGMLGLLFGGVVLGAVSKGLYRYLIGVRPLGILSIPLYYFALLSGIATPRGYIAGKWLFAIILCVIFLGTALMFFNMRVMRRGANSPLPNA